MKKCFFGAHYQPTPGCERKCVQKPGGCPKKAVNNTRAGCEWGESGKPTDCNVMLQ